MHVCPVRVDCLHYAVTVELKDNVVGEPDGIWGGVDIEMRRWLKQKIGDPAAYRARMADALLPERPDLPPRACGRCEATIAAGRHPIDRNGPRSTCGRASTYNKGCRCDACEGAKTLYDRDQKNRAAKRRNYDNPVHNAAEG